MTKHTPTPYAVEGLKVWSTDCTAKLNFESFVCEAKDSPTAAFIVKAVNCHDDLLMLARDYQESLCEQWCDENDPEIPHCEECVEASAIIAEVEGE